MPKIVCVDCETELIVISNDTIVIETALALPDDGIYKVYNADLWGCPVCGRQIVAGFGAVPIREDHYADDFKAWVNTLVSKTKNVIYSHEHH